MWALESECRALALSNFIRTIYPKRVVIGGSVMRSLDWTALRARVREVLAGYLQLPAILESMDSYLVAPSLGADSGVLGAIALAADLVS